jgi:hypothetical protein
MPLSINSLAAAGKTNVASVVWPATLVAIILRIRKQHKGTAKKYFLNMAGKV